MEVGETHRHKFVLEQRYTVLGCLKFHLVYRGVEMSFKWRGLVIKVGDELRQK